nr:hypothetical protein [Candidatus Sigynarchaeota archaeon]
MLFEFSWYPFLVLVIPVLYPIFRRYASGELLALVCNAILSFILFLSWIHESFGVTIGFFAGQVLFIVAFSCSTFIACIFFDLHARPQWAMHGEEKMVVIGIFIIMVFEITLGAAGVSTSLPLACIHAIIGILIAHGISLHIKSTLPPKRIIEAQIPYRKEFFSTLMKLVSRELMASMVFALLVYFLSIHFIQRPNPVPGNDIDVIAIRFIALIFVTLSMVITAIMMMRTDANGSRNLRGRRFYMYFLVFTIASMFLLEYLVSSLPNNQDPVIMAKMIGVLVCSPMLLGMVYFGSSHAASKNEAGYMPSYQAIGSIGGMLTCIGAVLLVIAHAVFLPGVISVIGFILCIILAFIWHQTRNDR